MAWPSPKGWSQSGRLGFLLHPSSSSVQSKCSPHPRTVPQQPEGDTVIRDLEVLDCQPHTRPSHCLLSLREDPSPQSVVQVMLFSAAERIKTTTTCTQASTQRPRRTKSPSREGPRGTGAKTPLFVHLQSGHSAAFL